MEFKKTLLLTPEENFLLSYTQKAIGRILDKKDNIDESTVRKLECCLNNLYSLQQSYEIKKPENKKTLALTPEESFVLTHAYHLTGGIYQETESESDLEEIVHNCYHNLRYILIELTEV